MKETNKIIPAILVKNFNGIEKQISSILGLSKKIQIDICDGIFVHNKTWPYSETSHLSNIENETEGMPYWEDIDFELDLMIKEPFLSLERFIKLGPTEIIFHYKAIQNDFDKFLAFKNEYDSFIKPSIAIHTEDDLEKADPFIKESNKIQIMGIKEIGKQGENMDEEVFPLIKKIKDEYPDKIIQVDGGVNEENILKLKDLGVNLFAIGSAIFKTDSPEESFLNINNLINNN